MKPTVIARHAGEAAGSLATRSNASPSRVIRQSLDRRCSLLPPTARAATEAPRLLPLSIAALMFALAACAGPVKLESSNIEKPADELYNGAMNKIAVGEYGAAVTAFDKLEKSDRWTIWTTKSQLMTAYAQYKEEKYNQAVISAERFIQLHPDDHHIAYAFYLKAISYYAQVLGVGHDQTIAKEAMKALGEVVRRFPDSKYARDAKHKLELTSNHLAANEMYVARFYQKHGEWLAALNRYKGVVVDYPAAAQVPEALERIVECDLKLGLADEAQRNAAALRTSFAQDQWSSYADANLGAKVSHAVNRVDAARRSGNNTAPAARGPGRLPPASFVSLAVRLKPVSFAP